MSLVPARPHPCRSRRGSFRIARFLMSANTARQDLRGAVRRWRCQASRGGAARLHEPMEDVGSCELTACRRSPVLADATSPGPVPRPEPGWSSRSGPHTGRQPGRGGTRWPERPGAGSRPLRRSAAGQRQPAPQMHQTESHPVESVPRYAIPPNHRPQCRRGDTKPGDPVPRRADRPAALRDQGVAGASPVPNWKHLNPQRQWQQDGCGGAHWMELGSLRGLAPPRCGYPRSLLATPSAGSIRWLPGSCVLLVAKVVGASSWLERGSSARDGHKVRKWHPSSQSLRAIGCGGPNSPEAEGFRPWFRWDRSLTGRGVEDSKVK